MLGSSKLPYGTLAFGTEGIRDAINGFDDACVILMIVDYHHLTTQLFPLNTVASQILRTNVSPLTCSMPTQKKAKPS